MASEKHLVNFVIDPELLKQIDDFRFRYRFVSRAAAIKYLLKWALDPYGLDNLRMDDERKPTAEKSGAEEQ